MDFQEIVKDSNDDFKHRKETFWTFSFFAY